MADTPPPIVPTPGIVQNNNAQWGKIQEAVTDTPETTRNYSRVTAVVGAAALILAGLGLHLDSQTQTALITLGVIFLPTIIGLGELIRSKVVPVDKVNKMLAASYKMVPTAGTSPPQV